VVQALSVKPMQSAIWPRHEEPVRHNLPLQLTSFVGRETALVELGQLLARTRLLSLTGAPGVGKTRLALQLADEAADAYADGVWLVELAPLADPGLVLQTVAHVVGVQEEAGRPLLVTLGEALRGKQLLLVLDNCEHLIEACAELADRLLRVCPHLEILATSREVLGIVGETAWWVPSLAVPAESQPVATDRLTSLGQSEAVRLFVERARASVPTFALTERNAGAVVQICSRLDGIALALELAAARVRVLSVEQLAARLDDALTERGQARSTEPFRLLTAGSRVAMPRQQTLRATLDWSYQLLTDPERVLLRRLAVFAGGWTMEAAERVVPDELDVHSSSSILPSDVLDLLVQLVNKSLVVADLHAEQQRYRLLEMVRQYAWEKLDEAGEEATLRHRHLAWLVALAETAQPNLRGPDEDLWLDRLERELDNLRVALAWSQQVPAEAESGLRLAGATWMFWYRRWRLSEGRGWLEPALAAATAPTAARIWAIFGACALAHVQGDLDRAGVLADEGLALSEELGDRRGRGYFLFGLARMAQERGDGQRAVVLAEESLVEVRAADDTLGTAISFGGLGLLAYERGDVQQATARYQEALTLYRELGDRYGIAWSLHYLGLAVHAQGDRERATALFQESLTLRREIDDAEGLAGSLEALAAVTAARGQLARGARLLAAAGTVRQTTGTPVPLTERAGHERTLSRVCDGLGAEAFAAAWAEGQAMSLPDAVAYALATEEPSAPPTRAPVRPVSAPLVGGLSRREIDVAILVAQGCTNREVAEHLVISEWTVDTHVRHILTKLNFRSRTQVAAWATEQGLHAPAPR